MLPATVFVAGMAFWGWFFTSGPGRNWNEHN